MKDIATIISAMASLAWPLFAAGVVLMFRKEIRALAGRVKRGKLFGQELELERQGVRAQANLAKAAMPSVSVLEVQELRAKANVADAASPSSPASSTARAESDPPNTRAITLAIAEKKPKLALLSLQGEIEKETRELLASIGLLAKRNSFPLQEMLKVLRDSNQVPATLVKSAESFLQIRNKIVHGRSASDDDILSAIDSGLTILDALAAVPHERHYVVHPATELFSDSQGKHSMGGRAVVLEARSKEGKVKHRAAYPTSSKYDKGDQVSWEWNMDKTFPEAWFKDPDSGELQYAWTSSAEFAGRSFSAL